LRYIHHMVGEVWAWMKSNSALLKAVPLCFRRLQRWRQGRPILRFTPFSDPHGLPFRNDWWFVAILLSNNRQTPASELSVTMEFRRGRAVFTPIRVPLLRQDPSSPECFQALQVTRLRSRRENGPARRAFWRANELCLHKNLRAACPIGCFSSRPHSACCNVSADKESILAGL
jgi:hypothetical protein